MPEAIENLGVVRCTRLEVLDADGVVRAVIRCTNDDPGEVEDAVVFELRDPKGRRPFEVSCDREAAEVALWQQGNTVARLWSHRNGSAGLTLSEPDEGTAVHVVTNGGD